MEVRQVTPNEASKALTVLQHSFGDKLLAVYLHGSAAAGGLRPSSDVDLMAVIDTPSTYAVRKHLVSELLEVSGRHPVDLDGRRPIEMIVFDRSDLAVPAFPMRCEFLYGEWLRERFEAGEVPEPHADPEFTLVLAQARRNAKALIGRDPAALLPIIPASDVRRAIGLALPTLLETLEGDERNVLLTLARMWRTLAIGDFVPKDVAADWAIPRLHAEAAALVAEARDAYLGVKSDHWQDRQQEVRLVASALGERVAAML
jgi:streptomycin 3"-adenylyltransferase